jgi:GT2 family glycosyltransferase
MITKSVVLGEDVTIATAAYGNAATTRLCLDSLFRSATGSYELILVDDCSPDAGAIRSLFLEAKGRHSNTKIFSFPENLEYSGSVGAVLSHATGQWVFFVSNDIFITPHYFRALLEAARENPRLGILRGCSNFVDNGLPSHNITPGAPVNSLQDVFNIGVEIAQRFGHAAEADPFLVGDAFLATRAVIERIGTFDPCFYGYFADQDYGLRAQIAGFGLALVRGAFAYHKQDANFGYLPEEQRQAKRGLRWMRVFENWARFKMKWGLPVALPYENIANLPWTQLAATPFDNRLHYSAAADYTHYLL